MINLKNYINQLSGAQIDKQINRQTYYNVKILEWESEESIRLCGSI